MCPPKYTACCRVGFSPVYLCCRPMFSQAAQPFLATLRATAVWLQAPCRHSEGTDVLTAQWPAGVARDFATILSKMTKVMASPHVMPHATVSRLHFDASMLRVSMLRVRTTVQQHHMHVMTCRKSVGPCQGLVVAATVYCCRMRSVKQCRLSALRIHLYCAPVSRCSGGMWRSQRQPKSY
jgi:hypothetical protein